MGGSVGLARSRAGEGAGERVGCSSVEMSEAAPVRYRAVAAGVVRTEAALDSDKAKPEKLTVGQEILVTEVQDVGGTIRLKFDGGCECAARFRVQQRASCLSAPLTASPVRCYEQGRRSQPRVASCWSRSWMLPTTTARALIPSLALTLPRTLALTTLGLPLGRMVRMGRGRAQMWAAPTKASATRH